MRAVCLLAVACALIAGLFLVHSPAPLSQGCPADAGGATADLADHHGRASMIAPAANTIPAKHPGASGAAVALGPSDRAGGEHGEVCVSTPPPGPLVAWAGLMTTVIPLAAGAGSGRLSGPAGGLAGRAPPLGGVGLLLRVCVTRT